MRKLFSNSNYILFECIIVICLFANILHTHQAIMHLPRLHHCIYPTSHIFFLLFEGFSIYFLSFLYPKRREILLLILYLLTTLILWINIGYSRYFDTYMPLSLYTEFNNLNGLLPNIKDAIEIEDSFFLITSIITIFAYLLYGRKVKTRDAYILPSMFMIILFLAFIKHYKSVKNDHDHLTNHFKELNDQRTIWDIMVDRKRMMENTVPKTCVSYYGIGLSLFLNGTEDYFRTERFHFTKEEKNTINKYMFPSVYQLPKDTIHNLIFILVESMSSYPIQKTFGGVEITPNLNKLLEEAYYNPYMESQALLGESSDGQFIYLTGLLPIKRGVTINEISSQHITTFVSLAKKQYTSLHSLMVIPTEKNNWSQEAMCRKYGIDMLISKENFSSKVEEDWLNDQQLFKLSSDAFKDLKTPFISFILTSSMHSPYIKSYEDYHINYPKDFTPEFKHYLDNVHYMDKYLGLFLEYIKQFPWYRECTIVITADHKPNSPKLNYNHKETSYIPLLIVSSHISKKGFKDTNLIYQTSLYPSILDMFHIRTKWQGVGKSIFMPDSIQKTTFEKFRKKHEEMISNYIINKIYLP